MYFYSTMGSYTIEDYRKDIEEMGLMATWDMILDHFHTKTDRFGDFGIEDFGDLYETGLEITDKESKKKEGKYYTPMDVAHVMAKWLVKCPGTEVCDVCCGCGNLILAYLEEVGYYEALKLLLGGHVWLYDLDELAMLICARTIGIIYGEETMNALHMMKADFLSRDTVLPENCKTISNPPYFKFDRVKDEWDEENAGYSSKELYAAMMSKILDQSVSSVIITPYSFLGGDKFLSLRQKMNDYSGYIVSFDNVPGNIFKGRKKGVFNSNTANSVRASITVTDSTQETKGYRCSELIRFKSEEREWVLDADALMNHVCSVPWIITETSPKYAKIDGRLTDIYVSWITARNIVPLKSLLSKEPTEWALCFPNTCRYFTVATRKDLSRTGKYVLYFKDEESMAIAYCWLNSSFAYWWWRVFDGGITYMKGLLEGLPIAMPDEKEPFIKSAENLMAMETQFLSYKKNAGEMQENVKFPDYYRNNLNRLILRSMYPIPFEENEKRMIRLKLLHQNGSAG